ncbi:MAG: hypothetical protein CL529_11705 [Aequorivita sp.]|nr:hypothetical protein [Aequorivita sp.]
MRTQSRFMSWAIANDKLPEGTLVIIEGGIPEVEYGQGQVSILDVDNLHDTGETEEDYEEAIQTYKMEPIIKGVCPWCLTDNDCSYWTDGNECNSEGN